MKHSATVITKSIAHIKSQRTWFQKYRQYGRERRQQQNLLNPTVTDHYLLKSRSLQWQQLMTTLPKVIHGIVCKNDHYKSLSKIHCPYTKLANLVPEILTIHKGGSNTTDDTQQHRHNLTSILATCQCPIMITQSGE